MHIHVKLMPLLFVVTCALSLAACDSEEKVTILPIGGGSVFSAGKMTTYKFGSVSFRMASVPAGQMFPAGVDDADVAFVAEGYLISETEVTYDLWYRVHHWAVTDTGGGLRADGGPIYTFANPGREGDDGLITAPEGSPPTADRNEPVTGINWRDAIIWCNALSEWYNANNGSKPNLDCVYYTDDAYTTPLRASTNDAVDNPLVSGLEDQPYIMAATTGNIDMANCAAKGFRLPASMEWECAARYKDGMTWTAGDYASGATADWKNNAAVLAVGVFYYIYDDGAWLETGVTSTDEVMTKNANALGLYDMSGNVWEWCFDWHPLYSGSLRVLRGSSWYEYAEFLQIGYVGGSSPYYGICDMGFRFVRTQ